VGPEGFIGGYRKTHLWETEEHWSSYGDLGVPVFDTALGRIAINICMDSAYFESARLAALGGADVLAFPTNSTSQALSALPARAIQNGLFIVSANRSNTENNYHMIGGSAIWAPDGSCLAQMPLLMASGEEETGPATIAYATIDPAQYHNAGKELLRARRPELYKDLMLHIAPWNYVKSTAPQELKGYVVQFKPLDNDVSGNAAKIRSLLAEALGSPENRKDAPDIIVFPENALYGAEFTKQSVDTGFFAGIAREYGSYVVGTFVESEGENHYIAAALYDRDGNIAGRYRKTHLSEKEKSWASPGDDIPVFVTNIGRIGIIIGDEVRYPEIAGLLAVLRADMIAIPSSWAIWDGGEWQLPAEMSANPYPEHSMVLWDAVGIGAQSYTLVANYSGSDYFGVSGIYTLDPLYGLDQPEVLAQGERALRVNFRTIQPEWWFNQEMLINSRRSVYYKPLVVEYGSR
jgi:predicted amidohydrolase